MMLGIEKLLTRIEVEEQYKGARCLEIEMHPDHSDRVIGVSYKEPCMACGKYHHFMSKAEKNCIAKIVGMTYCIMNERGDE